MCPGCGTTAIIYRSRGGERSEEWERFLTNCLRCGVVADGPEPFTPHELSAPARSRAGETLPIRIRLVGLDAASIVAGAISVNGVGPLGWQMRPELLPAATTGAVCGTRHVSLSVPRELPSLVYYVRVFLLLDGLPWFLTRPVVIHDGLPTDEQSLVSAGDAAKD